MPEAAFLRVVSGWLQPERVHFSLLYNHSLSLSICVCWKHKCLLIHTTKSSDSVISSTQGNKRYGRRSHRRFFCELSLRKWCSVFKECLSSALNLWANIFLNLKLGAWRKQPFCLTKLEYLQSQNLSKHHTGAFFHSLWQQVSASICVFWENHGACCFCGESSDSTVLADKGKTEKEVHIYG